MWYEFCFGATMGSGDIEVQVKARTLKHINTDIIENTVTLITRIRERRSLPGYTFRCYRVLIAETS